MNACDGCGKETAQENYCEHCGASLHRSGQVEDIALSLMLGRVCPNCDSYNDPGTAHCVMCSAVLDEGQPANKKRAAPSWMGAPEGEPIATKDALPAVAITEVGKKAVPAPPTMFCESCGEELAIDDKFCSSCGTKTGGAPSLAQPAATPSKGTLFFGAVSTAKFARLVLVKGTNEHGAQWRLPTGEAMLGREGDIAFPSDLYLARYHCVLRYAGDHVEIEPIDETNGVYAGVKDKIALAPGDEFVVGTKRVQLLSDDDRKGIVEPAADGTSLLGSMTHGKAEIVLRRVSNTPELEEIYVRPQRLLTIGRSLCDVNFPSDPYLSVRHAQIAKTVSGYVLEDLGSRNGTYKRISDTVKLFHGDAIMVGDQVLRVEIVG